MQEVKKIALKVVLLMGILIALNWVYERFLFEGDLEKYSEAGSLLYEVRDSAEVLYLGESSDFTISDEDTDKRSISQYLAAYFPEMNVLRMSKGALHAGNYYDLLRNMPANGPLKTVVVTMNLRSFGTAWIYSKLETALQKEMVLLKPGPALWNRLMLTFRNYKRRTKEETHALQIEKWKADNLHFESDSKTSQFPFPSAYLWDSAVANGILPLANGSLEEAQRTLATHYIKGFAFQIDLENNPRIRDFDNIVALAQSRGWNLIFNLLPENFEKADELLGPRLVQMMEKNCELLKARYGRLEGVTLVDNSHIAPNAHFRDQDWTTEHYTEPSRRKIAKNVASAVKAYHPENYVKVKAVAVTMQSSFSNDCEGDLIWSQMKSLDDARAKSGQKSSRFGGGQAFGLTFTYPLAKLDSSKLDSLLYECWLYRTASDTFMDIAIEASGENTHYHWDRYMLKDIGSELNAWEHVQLRIPLWPDLRSADVFKVYPYNKGGNQAWIDDIKITFKSKSDN